MTVEGDMMIGTPTAEIETIEIAFTVEIASIMKFMMITYYFMIRKEEGNCDLKRKEGVDEYEKL
jgi:hypothetical protein